MPEPVGGFTKTGLTVEELQQDDLYGVLVQAVGEAAPVSPAALHAKLRAAEDHYERRLQVYLGERRIASNARSRLGIGGPVALTADDYDVDQVGYDFDSSRLQAPKWGQFKLAMRPVLSITRAFLALPSGSLQTPWIFPEGWLVPDYETGQIEIFPNGSAQSAIREQIFGMVTRHMYGAAQRWPKAFHVDYVAGITKKELRRNHMDLLEGIRLRTLLFSFGMLTTTRDGGGVGGKTISLDGLSRSQTLQSGKYGPYTGRIEQAIDREAEILSTWRDAEQGLVFA